jgi:uncharacterized membrane protein YeaQ/YmgE (transglycosylase-associated protein family)
MELTTGKNLFMTILIGGIGGYLAGLVLKGRGFSFISSIILGIIGSIIGRNILKMLGIVGTGFLFQVFTAFIGAILFIIIKSKFFFTRR